MKRISFIFLLLISSTMLHAQFFQVTEGPVFPDSTIGYAKIIQMKNGSTMYFNVNFKKGINVQSYEPVYRDKTETNLEPAYGMLSAGKVEGIFEVGGNAVLLITDNRKDEVVLFRLIVDGKSGKLIEEKQLVTVKKSANMNAPDLLPQLAVRQDPSNEDYAVATLNSFESDTSKRVNIMLYSKDNKEAGNFYYMSKEEKYKYFQFMDMVIVEPGKVALLLYGYNSNNAGEKTGEIVYISAEKGTALLNIKDLNYSNDLVPSKGLLRLDPLSKRLLFLTAAFAKSDPGKIKTNIYVIDPLSKKIISSKSLSPAEKVNAKYSDLLGKKTVYAGSPQNLFLNRDGSFTVIFENLQEVKEKDNSINTVMSNPVVANFDKDEELISAYLVPIQQTVTGVQMPAFYHAEIAQTGQLFYKDNQYKLPAYISDGHSHFVLFNGNEMYDQNSGNKIAAISTQDAFYSSLSSKDVVPFRKYIFAKPKDDETHKLASFSVYDYDSMNNILVILRQEKTGPHPGVQLVWIQP